MMDICFIVLNYNGFQETSTLVDSFRDWDSKLFTYRIVVVDNCSTDSSFSQLQERFSNTEYVDVIRSEKNGGYSYGNNFGARFAVEHYHPEYIAIANPDIQVNQTTVAQLLKTFLADDKIAAVAPVMKNLSGGFSIGATRLPEYKDDLRACWTEKPPRNAKPAPRKTVEGYPSYLLTETLTGSFFVVRSSSFLDVGMLDENTFLFCEERILGFRMKQKGYTMVVRTDLFFVHAHSVTIKKVYDTIGTWKLIWQSRLYYEKEYIHASYIKLLFLKMNSVYFLHNLAIRMYLYQWKTKLLKENRG